MIGRAPRRVQHLARASARASAFSSVASASARSRLASANVSSAVSCALRKIIMADPDASSIEPAATGAATAAGRAPPASASDSRCWRSATCLPSKSSWVAARVCSSSEASVSIFAATCVICDECSQFGTARDAFGHHWLPSVSATGIGFRVAVGAESEKTRTGKRARLGPTAQEPHSSAVLGHRACGRVRRIQDSQQTGCPKHSR